MNAVIYVRVSSPDQIEGTSLESQELACREYARRHSLEVSSVFVEQGESAKFADRAQLLRLLDYCKIKSNAVAVLIVWKLDRFARNVEDHFAIKATLRRYGVSVVSVTEPIAADANGKLMETILAGFAAFDNDVRAMRTVQGLQQKLRQGLFPWKPPLGYLPTKTGRKTTPDLVDPRRFEPLQKAWQLFATGAYSKAAILRLLQNWGVLAYRGTVLSAQAIDHIFQNPYYAGILKDPWTGNEYQGRHVAMVSQQDFACVQQIIAIRNNIQPHHRANEAFPVRGLVRCPTCQHRLTGAFARGERKSYPYYNCFQRACPTRTRSYPAGAVNHEFIKFIRELGVPAPLCAATLNQIREVVVQERQTAEKAALSVAQDISTVDRQLQELVSMRAKNLISDEEFLSQRETLQQRRREMEAHNTVLPDQWLTATHERVLIASMQDVHQLWQDTPSDQRRVFEELILPAGYVFKEIRTAERGLLFSVFTSFGDDTSNVMHLVKPNLNKLFNELMRFLSIIQSTRHREEPVSEAA